MEEEQRVEEEGQSSGAGWMKSRGLMLLAAFHSFDVT